MTNEEILEGLNKLENGTDRQAIITLLKRPLIQEHIQNRLNGTVFDSTERNLTSHDRNVLTNIFINSGQSYEDIIEFINSSSSIGRKNLNIINRTTNKHIARDLFHFTPTIGNNPTGPGEFLLAFHFSNVTKNTTKGDLIIDGHKYELKSSINRSSGGGTVNSTDSTIYGTPTAVMRTLSKFLDIKQDSNILNMNKTNMLNLFNRLDRNTEKVQVAGVELFKGLYPKISNQKLDFMVGKYISAVTLGRWIQFDEEFRLFQVRYYLDNHKDKLLFINKQSGNIKSINSRSTREDILSLNYKNSINMRSSTNNTYQFSID